MTARSIFLILVLLLACVPRLEAEPVLALVGGTILDLEDAGRSEQDIEDGIVVVSGDRIEAVGRASELAITENAQVLDVSGKWIMPGLVDGFGALNNQSYAQAYLAMGVTSLVTVSGGRRGNLFRYAEPGPHLYPLDGVGSDAVPTEELLEQIEDLARAGHRVVLLMYGLRPDQIVAAVARARELGMATIGELGHTSYEAATELDLDAFVHTTRYSLDLAPPDLAGAVARQPFSDDLESPKWKYYRFLSGLSADNGALGQYAQVLGQGSVALMPTLSLLYLDLPDSENPWKLPVAQLLDAGDINAPANRVTGRHDYAPERASAYRDLAQQVLVLEQAYRKAGALYLAGSATDVWGTMPGISLHTELDLLTRIGLTNRQAIAAATSNFSEVFRWPELGLVEAGRRADLLVLDGDPMESLAHLQNIDKVILGGRVFSRESLLDPPKAPLDGALLSREALTLSPGISEMVQADPHRYSYLSQVTISGITYGSDGLRVRGFLLLPKGEGPFPCVIFNRGGNREFGAINERKLVHQLAPIAAWGYVVAASQYRGNGGGEGMEEFGGSDVRDVLNLIPLLESLKEADASRLGMVGGSRGGMMAYLVLKETDRFQAVVIRAGLTDAHRMIESRPEMEEVYKELAPGFDEDRENILNARSPLLWAHDLPETTPLLILHGTSDWRVVPDMAIDMSRALLAARRPFRLVLLEGGNHALTEHRGEVLRLTREWLDAYVRDLKPLPDLEPHGL